MIEIKREGPSHKKKVTKERMASCLIEYLLEV
jgi:hypothetical protein